MINLFKLDSKVPANNVVIVAVVVFSMLYPSVLGLVIFEGPLLKELDWVTCILIYLALGIILLAITSLGASKMELQLEERMNKDLPKALLLIVCLHLIVFTMFCMFILPILYAMKYIASIGVLWHPWVFIFILVWSYYFFSSIVFWNWQRIEKAKQVDGANTDME